jgi:hypothetical protein
MTEHNVDPQEIEDREDLESLLSAPTAGAWHPQTWRTEYVVAEGEHDTARLYGWRSGAYCLLEEGDPFVIRNVDIADAANHAEDIAKAAAQLGADVRPLIRSRRVVIVATPWHTEGVPRG